MGWGLPYKPKPNLHAVIEQYRCGLGLAVKAADDLHQVDVTVARRVDAAQIDLKGGDWSG